VLRRFSACVAVMCATVLAACGSSHNSASPTTTAGRPSTTTAVPGAAATLPPSTGPSTTGSAPNPRPATTTTVPAQASAAGNGSEYLGIVTPLTSAFESAPADPTRAQLEQLASEVRAAQARLSAFHWPGPAETDIRTLVNELTPLASELAQGDAGAVNSTTDTLTSASVTIKLDLGLPTSPR
jgi:hypothetical protein